MRGTHPSLTSLQCDLDHDTVLGLGRAGLVCSEPVVTHVHTPPTNAGARAERTGATQLGGLGLAQQRPLAQAGPYHKGQQALFYLL